MHSRVALRSAIALLVCILAVAPMPVEASLPDSTPTRQTDISAAPGDFSLDLADEADFVSQYTEYWCVGASMQMMLNVIGVTEDNSRPNQERYMRVARSSGESLQQVDHGEPADGLRGAGSSGWARGLVLLGAGLYAERALDDFDGALREAARAIRATQRPVGLIVWRGAHAWVMTGFSATADPLVNPDFDVTGVYVMDSWYPRVSSIWGPGQKPNTWIAADDLTADFLPRRGGQWHAELAGKFVIVMPVEPERRSPVIRLAS